MLRPALLLALIGCCLCRPVSGCDLNQLPEPIRERMAKEYPSWKVVEEGDLSSRDLSKFWRPQHGRACPGFVAVRSRPNSQPSIALVLIPRSRSNYGAKLIVFDRNGSGYKPTVLSDGTDVAGSPVVFQMPPGVYESAEGETKVNAKKPVFFYVRYEAWAVMYYWDGNEYQELQVSE